MYYDLNVPFVPDLVELQQTLLFLSELGYETIALDHSIVGKVPPEISTAIPDPLPFNVPQKIKILRRCTLHLSDPSQNYRLPQLSSAYDVFALRPTTEKAFQLACHNLECDIISLDFSVRHPFFFMIKTVKTAIERGIKFEICYAPGIVNADNGVSRRNLISNATQLIRATRGRGLIISSEAKRAVACRSPADLINLAVLWGLPQDRGAEAVEKEARNVVVQAQMKRRSFRGVIDVIHGGSKADKPVTFDKSKTKIANHNKRKADATEDEVGAHSSTQALSKREQKRRAKKARRESAGIIETESPKGSEQAVTVKSSANEDCPSSEHDPAPIAGDLRETRENGE